LQHAADLTSAYRRHALPPLPPARRNGALCYDAEDIPPRDWPEDNYLEEERHIVRRIEGRDLPGCEYVTRFRPRSQYELCEAYGPPVPTVVSTRFQRRRRP